MSPVAHNRLCLARATVQAKAEAAEDTMDNLHDLGQGIEVLRIQTWYGQSQVINPDNHWCSISLRV